MDLHHKILVFPFVCERNNDFIVKRFHPRNHGGTYERLPRRFGEVGRGNTIPSRSISFHEHASEESHSDSASVGRCAGWIGDPARYDQVSQLRKYLPYSALNCRVFFEADIGESFVDTLLELNKKMVFVRAQPGKKIRALKDIGPELERLRLKVTDRIRQYLLEKIKSLSLPNTNISIIQQSILIKYKSLQHFVIQRHNDAANELSLTYIQIMNSYYFSKFSKYGTKIQKLSLVIADKTDMIGVDDSSKKGFSLLLISTTYLGCHLV